MRMKIKYLLIVPVLPLLLECKSIVDCALGKHTGDLYRFNVKVIDGKGKPVLGAYVITIPAPNSLDGEELEEFGSSLQSNDRIKDVLGVTDIRGVASTTEFYLGCEAGPISNLIEQFVGRYCFPHSINILVYKQGYVPKVIEAEKLWVFELDGAQYLSQMVPVEVITNKAIKVER